MSQKDALLNLGWNLINDKNQELFSISKFTLYQFVTSAEEYITWDMMLDRAKGIGAYGSQNLAEHILEEQNNIPEEWKKYNIVLPNTTWKSVTGHSLCPYLSFKNNKWVLQYYWFLYDFHHNDRFLIIK